MSMDVKETDMPTDEYGEYEVRKLSMLKGGQLKSIKVHKHPRPHVVLPKQKLPPMGWYKPKTPDSNRVRPRPCYTEAVLTKPWGGACSINCSYCYILGGTRGWRWTGLPTVAPGYPEYMGKCLNKMMVSGPWYITSFSEPFYPKLEEKYHITKRLSEVLISEGLPFFYLTKQSPPDWAFDYLTYNPYSYLQMSINTPNNDHWRRMAPGAPDLDVMYADIQYAHELGVYVSIQVNPIVAGVTDLADIIHLCELVAQAGAQHVIFKFVEQVTARRQVIVDRMNDRKLPHVDTFDNLFSQVIGGVYTIQEDLRIEWLDHLLKVTRELGLTMSTCYEYFDDGKAGANYAPFVTTADQCHGRGVPLYFRPEKGAPWEPLPGCYRKGCLYCADYGTKACDTPALLEASALQYKDLRSIHLKGDGYSWVLEDSCTMPEYAEWYITQAPRGNPIRFNEAAGNPQLQTDAEMWGWELVEDD